MIGNYTRRNTVIFFLCLKCLRSLTLGILVTLLPTTISAQQYADKEHYLIDSLNFQEINSQDSLLIDSLIRVYQTSNHDTTRLGVLITLANQLSHERTWWAYNQLVEERIGSVMEMQSSQNEKVAKRFKQILGDCYNNIGYYEGERNNYLSELEYYKRSLAIRTELNDLKGMSQCYNNLGYLLQHQGDLGGGMEYYMKSLKIREQLGDLQGQGFTYNNVGFIYREQGDLKEAEKCYLKSLEVREKVGDKKFIALSLNNLSMIYMDFDDYEKSLKYSYRALEIQKEVKNIKGQANCYNNIGAVYKTTGNYEKAFEYYALSRELWLQQNYKRGLVSNNSNLSDICLELGRTNEAMSYAKESYGHAIEIDQPDAYMSAHKALYQVFKATGDYEKALFNYEKFILNRDSLNSEQNKKEVIRQQTKYEFEKAQLVKEQELKEESRKQKEETDRRNNLQYSIIFLGILLFFGVVLSLGFIKVSQQVAEGLIFFAFLILFEFLLVLGDPFVERITGGEPIYKLLANALLAGLIFPAHAFFERALKKRLVKVK